MNNLRFELAHSRYQPAVTRTYQRLAPDTQLLVAIAALGYPNPMRKAQLPNREEPKMSVFIFLQTSNFRIALHKIPASQHNSAIGHESLFARKSNVLKPLISKDHLDADEITRNLEHLLAVTCIDELDSNYSDD